MVPAAGVSRGPARIGILTGPTATGKTAVAIEWALRLGDIEIVNADSLLVYRGMDIGTAKPSIEERAGVPHHLIDVREPDEAFTAGDFVRAVEAVLRDVQARGKRALIVGGTGFYLKALVFGLWDSPPSEPSLRAELEQAESAQLYLELEARDSKSALRIGPADRYRLIRAVEILRLTGKSPTELEEERPREPDPRFTLWILDRPGEELERRIALRARAMLDAGLVEETRGLHARFPDARSLSSVGYAQTVAYLEGAAPEGRQLRPGLEGLEDEIRLATRQLVKRQRTWFRGQTPGRWFTLDGDRAELDRAIETAYPA